MKCRETKESRGRQWESPLVNCDRPQSYSALRPLCQLCPSTLSKSPETFGNEKYLKVASISAKHPRLPAHSQTKDRLYRNELFLRKRPKPIETPVAMLRKERDLERVIYKGPDFYRFSQWRHRNIRLLVYKAYCSCGSLSLARGVQDILH